MWSLGSLGFTVEAQSTVTTPQLQRTLAVLSRVFSKIYSVSSSCFINVHEKYIQLFLFMFAQTNYLCGEQRTYCGAWRAWVFVGRSISG